MTSVDWGPVEGGLYPLPGEDLPAGHDVSQRLLRAGQPRLGQGHLHLASTPKQVHPVSFSVRLETLFLLLSPTFPTTDVVGQGRVLYGRDLSGATQ